MASIRSISVRDFSGATNIGGLADLLNITLTLDEAVTVSNGTINLSTVRPSFFIGNQPIAATRVSFLSYNPSARSITYQLSFPLNIYDTKVTLTGLALNQITIGFIINGASTNQNAGGSASRGTIAGAGDVNGDGYADLLIGASRSVIPSRGVTATGQVFIVFGKPQTTAVELSAVQNGTGGFVINGETLLDQAGAAISSAGDVNGDGLADIIVGAPYLDRNGQTDVGRSYVIFGKTDGTKVELSAIVNGTGGFAIIDDLSYQLTGVSVSPAGDVNGDGLDDLLIGAPSDGQKVDPYPIHGKAYVIFGKADTQPVYLQDIVNGIGTGIRPVNTPSNGADNYSGSSNDELIMGGAGNDTLSGGGGADVLLGGLGDDVLELNASNVAKLLEGLQSKTSQAGFDYYNVAHVDGGAGIDTLRLMGVATLDFTAIKDSAAGNKTLNNRIHSIEKIDLASDRSANLIKLSLTDVINMAGFNVFNTSPNSGWTGTGLDTSVPRHQLVISGGTGQNGNTQDSVDIIGFSTDSGAINVWAKQLINGSPATVVNNNIAYEIWNHNTAAVQLLIQQNVQVI